MEQSTMNEKDIQHDRQSDVIDTTISQEEQTNSELSQVNGMKLDSEVGANDTQWFYVAKNYYSGEIYNIDKDGNLIASLSYADGKIDIDSKKNMTPDEESKVLTMIRNSRKQIDFVKRQEELKEEIKGYPEFNESLFQLFEPDKTFLRFKSQKSILRSLMDSDNFSFMRVLLSIVYLKKYDDFINMLGIVIDIKTLSDSKLDNLIKFIYNWSKTGELPPIKAAFNWIGLPYSKEFCEEYLLDEKRLENCINFYYKEVIKKRYKHLSEFLREYDGPVEKVKNLVDIIEKQSKPPTINDTFNELQEYLDSKENEIRLSTGIKELDDKEFYLPKGKICSVFAYTGSFKTMFSSNVAYNIMKSGGNVLYLSLEISKSEMYINFLSRHSYNYDKNLSHSDIKANRITQDDKDYLFKIIYPDFKEELKQHLIIYDETDISSNNYATFNKLLSQADREFIKQTGTGIDLIIVDHLNLLKFGMNSKVQNDYSAVNHWMSYFRKNCIDFLSKKKQVAILCACQSSREGYKKAKKDGKYDLTSIAEGNEIERSSAYVLSLYTSESDRENNTTQMQILKLRDEAPSDELIEVHLAPKYYTFGIEPEKNADTDNSPDGNPPIKENSQDVINYFRGSSDE